MLEDGDDCNPSPRGRAARASPAGQIGRALAGWLHAVVLAPRILQIGGGSIDLGIVATLQFGAGACPRTAGWRSIRRNRPA